MSAPTRDQFGFSIRLPVRWGDMDALGHVNNAVYFTYDESARIDFFQQLIAGDDAFWTEHGFILANIGCQFLSQLKPPADIDIGFRVTRIGNSSMHTQSCVFLADEAIAVTQALVCWFDYRQQKTARVPDHVRDYILERSAVPPEM